MLVVLLRVLLLLLLLVVVVLLLLLLLTVSSDGVLGRRQIIFNAFRRKPLESGFLGRAKAANVGILVSTYGSLFWIP